jgi:NCS1 family nucleobase:cation symporter-1
MNNFGQFLTLMSYFMAPWLAIMLIDYFRRDPQEKPEPFYDRDGIFAGVMWKGMSSFLTGFVVSIPFMANDFYTGPIATRFGGADTSYFISFLVAGLIYLTIRTARHSAATTTLDGNPTRT